MRKATPLVALLALAIATAVMLAVTSVSGTDTVGNAKPSESAWLGGQADIPPPCYETWAEAFAAGYPTPELEAHGVIMFSADPTPTPGPPFDMTQTPPPPGFDSWDEVIDSWIEAKEQGLLGLDAEPVTPELVGPPPSGCSSWEEFAEWIDRNVGDIIPEN